MSFYMFCVALSMDMLFFMLRVCELFGATIRNMFVCGCYFLLNVIELLLWLEVLCWIDQAWSSKGCVCGVPVIPVCI